MTRVLVTGGTGGLDSEVVNRLMKAGYQVARALLLARMRSMDYHVERMAKTSAQTGIEYKSNKKNK